MIIWVKVIVLTKNRVAGTGLNVAVYWGSNITGKGHVCDVIFFLFYGGRGLKDGLPQFLSGKRSTENILQEKYV